MLCLLVTVAVLPAVAFAADDVNPTIRPQDPDDTAVRAASRVEVSGTAPAGNIQGARLLAMTRSGEVLGEQIIPDGDLNKPGVSGVTNDYLRNDGGKLSGQLTLGCKFAEPSDAPGSCTPPGVEVVVLQVTVAGHTGRSNAVRVDYIRPRIAGYEVIQTDRIRVVFTEPVRHEQGDLPSDWEVVGRNVVAVENPPEPDCREPKQYPEAEHECTRVLVLDRPLHEDATPTVDYTNTSDAVPTRTAYQDFASNRAFTIGLARLVALDLVRPAKPNIESVGGSTPSANGDVRGSNPAPTVRLNNLTPLHTVRVTVSGPGEAQQLETKVPEDANSVDLQLKPLGGDGTYTISALAIDPHDNSSEEHHKSPPRADGRATVQYIVDTLVPRALLATLVNRRTVEVQFTEPIVPAGHAGRWFVGDVPVTAEGSGDRRTLRSTNDLHGPAQGDWLVRWEPTSESAEPGTPGRYGDNSGNGLAAFQLPITDLPAIPAPGVTAPAGELYTNRNSVTVAGTAPDQANLVAELYDRGAEQPRSSAPVSGGRWSIEQELDADRRYEFEVRLRDTQTGNASPRTGVPDVVRDTTAPVVDVRSPDQRPLSVDNPTERRREYGVGSSVEIRWVATDEAPNDPERSDHGDFATIFLVGSDGSRRVIADKIPHQPGAQEQSHSYTLTAADLAGQASRQLHFEVAVTDLATNRGSDTSAPFLLLADLIGYTPVLVQTTRIDARFPVVLTGETAPGEWYVDGTPAQQAQKTTENGVTVVRLTVAQNSDRNWTPTVEYRPATVNPMRLRSEGGAPVSTEGHETVDVLAPALSVESPNVGSRPIDADNVRFSGTTDRSSSPNTIFAFRTDDKGALLGSAIASTTAGTDGEWQMDVPLTQNAVNRIVVRASDPSGNVSPTLPNPPFSVVEDSLAPVVVITSPKSGSLVAPVFDITWQTTEANKESVRIEYRVGAEPWQPIADRIPDTGTYRWEMPESVQREIFSLRVTAMDQSFKTGSATVDGLRLDLEAPTILKARASGAQVVDVTFSEPVTLDGSGFTIGGATVRRVKGDGLKRTFILDSAVDSTTPLVEYSGSNVRDVGGNELEAGSVTAKRAFAFGITALKGTRVTSNRVRVTWTDSRNRSADLRGYRIYRDGSPIALVGSATRAFTDAKGAGRHVYSVRAVDDRRRVSSTRRVVVR